MNLTIKTGKNFRMKKLKVADDEFRKKLKVKTLKRILKKWLKNC